MRPDRWARWLAAIAVSATAAVAFWGYSVYPDRGLRWFAVATFLPALWVFVEIAQFRGDDRSVEWEIMGMHQYCIAWAGLMLSSQIGFRLAIHVGLLDRVWLPTGRRLVGLMLGVGLLLFGNALPTLRSPWTLRQQPFAWQQVHRFVGWVYVLAGSMIVGCWALLPVDAASRASTRILGISLVLALGRKLTSLMRSSHRTLARQTGAGHKPWSWNRE